MEEWGRQHNFLFAENYKKAVKRGIKSESSSSTSDGAADFRQEGRTVNALEASAGSKEAQAPTLMLAFLSPFPANRDRTSTP